MSRILTALILAVFVIGFGLGADASIPLTPITPAGPEKTVLKSLYRGGLEGGEAAGGTVLARCDWGELTEADFFVYLVMTGDEDPLLLENYRKAPPGDERQALRERLDRALRGWAAVQRLAVEENEKTRNITPSDYLRLRMLTHPVHTIVWIDKFLVPQVRVMPEDIIKFYHEHPENVLAPAKATVRYIFLPCETHEPPAAPAAGPDSSGAAPAPAEPLPMGPKCTSALEKIGEIRDQILDGKIEFAEAARLHSKAPNAAEGGLAEFQKGAFFPEFEEAAFTLESDHMSNLIHGPKGFYYIQGVDRETNTPLELEDAKPIIEPYLYFLQLHHRYSYEFVLLTRETRIVNHSYGIGGLKPDDVILKVGAFTLTKSQAWALYPQFVTERFEIQKNKMAYRLNDFAHKELMVRYNLDHGWNEEPLLQAGRRMAKVVLLAQKGWTRKLRSRLNLSHAEVRRYILDRPEIFPIPPRSGEPVPAVPASVSPSTTPALPGLEGETALPARSPALEKALLAGPGNTFKSLTKTRFTLIQIRYVPSIDRGQPHRESEMLRMRGVLARARDAMSTKTLEQIVTEWPTRETIPSSIVPNWVRSEVMKQTNSNLLVGLRSSIRGFEGIPKEFQEHIEDVRKTLPYWIASGTRFLPIEETENTLSLFYVEQPDYRSPVIAESIRYTLYEIAANAIKLEILDKVLRESDPENRVKLLLD